MLKLITSLVLVQQIWIIHHNVRGDETTDSSVLERVSHSRFYKPNYGYQPYWPGGDWQKSDDPNATTTEQVPLVCGRECHYLYIPIKEVCGRHLWRIHYDGCWPYKPKWCQGWPPGSLVRGYETFDTYCQFLDYQCKSGNSGGEKTIMHKWIYVHLGKCTKDDVIFKTMYYGEEPISRMKFYLSSQAETFKDLDKEPC